MAQPQRNDLKEFILACFSRDEFITFCADYFRDFYEDYEGADLPKSALANKLVEHCERREVMDSLRANLQRARRERYLSKFEPVRLAEVKAQPRNPRQVFLSHAHDDAEFAQKIAADLREAGLSVWMTPDSIQPGESWVSAIDRGLSESGIFIVVLTPNSVRSPWVKTETQWALQAEKNKLVRLVPVQAQPCDVAQLSNLLTLAQYVNFEHGERGYPAGAIALFRALGLQHKAEREQLRVQAETAAQAKRAADEARRQREAAADYARLRAAEERQRQLQAEPARIPLLPNDNVINIPAPTPVSKAGVSRRVVVLGLGGLAAGGIGVAWLASRGPAAAPATPTARAPTREPQPTEQPAAPTEIAIRGTPTPANKLALDLAPGVTMPLVRVPAGEFWMGSDKTKDALTQDDEQPAHPVFLSEYAIGKYEVTVAEFAAFTTASSYKTTAEQQGSAYAWNGTEWKDTPGANWQHPRGPESDVSQKQNHPVSCISWDDAAAFCVWASKQTGQVMRLPTEAQWEKAARGPDARIYPWGNEVPDAARCNFNMNVKDTTPVGQYSPAGDSPYGAADMAGNLWEWCLDWYDAQAYKNRTPGQVKDPTGPASGTGRVVRGGAWDLVVVGCRSASRYWLFPQFRYDYLGFRVVVVSPLFP